MSGNVPCRAMPRRIPVLTGRRRPSSADTAQATRTQHTYDCRSAGFGRSLGICDYARPTPCLRLRVWSVIRLKSSYASASLHGMCVLGRFLNCAEQPTVALGFVRQCLQLSLRAGDTAPAPAV